jgi:hypothetical protein
MSALSVHPALPRASGNSCHLVVLSEDPLSQESVMAACGRLLALFENEVAFAFSFYGLADLNNRALAPWVAQAVAGADILVFSLRDNVLSPGVMKWLESCVPLRVKAEGALAVTVANPTGSVRAVEALWWQMQRMADRLGMDFLPLLPPQVNNLSELPAQPFPELLAQDEIDVGHDHWGLNE